MRYCSFCKQDTDCYRVNVNGNVNVKCPICDTIVDQYVTSITTTFRGKGISSTTGQWIGDSQEVMKQIKHDRRAKKSLSNHNKSMQKSTVYPTDKK